MITSTYKAFLSQLTQYLIIERLSDKMTTLGRRLLILYVTNIFIGQQRKKLAHSPDVDKNRRTTGHPPQKTVPMLYHVRFFISSSKKASRQELPMAISYFFINTSLLSNESIRFRFTIYERLIRGKTFLGNKSCIVQFTFSQANS